MAGRTLPPGVAVCITFAGVFVSWCVRDVEKPEFEPAVEQLSSYSRFTLLTIHSTIECVIRSFASPETEIIWRGRRSTKLPIEIQRVARRKLRMLNNASELFELRSPPNNRLEKLKGGCMEQIANIHPGEVLKEEFLVPLGISAYRLAKDTGLPQTRISEIIHGRRRVSADTALRLAKYFGTTPKFWLGLQDDYDLEEQTKQSKAQLDRIPTVSSMH